MNITRTILPLVFAITVFSAVNAFSQSSTVHMVDGTILAEENAMVADGFYTIVLTIPGVDAPISTVVETFDGIFSTVIELPTGAEVASLTTAVGGSTGLVVTLAPIVPTASTTLSVTDFEEFADEIQAQGIGTPLRLLKGSAGTTESRVAVAPTPGEFAADVAPAVTKATN